MANPEGTKCARRRTTVSTRTRGDTGLVRNSSAPRARACSAFTLSSPVTTRTGSVRTSSASRTRRRISRPSRSGKRMSRINRSGAPSPMAARASAPVAACKTVKPALSRAAAMGMRTSASSSTSRTLFALGTSRRGSRTTNRAPCPGPALSAQTRPPCNSTSLRTRARPSPAPAWARVWEPST